VGGSERDEEAQKRQKRRRPPDLAKWGSVPHASEYTRGWQTLRPGLRPTALHAVSGPACATTGLVLTFAANEGIPPARVPEPARGAPRKAS
jgi:hypothetical protein